MMGGFWFKIIIIKDSDHKPNLCAGTLDQFLVPPHHECLVRDTITQTHVGGGGESS